MSLETTPKPGTPNQKRQTLGETFLVPVSFGFGGDGVGHLGAAVAGGASHGLGHCTLHAGLLGKVWWVGGWVCGFAGRCLKVHLSSSIEMTPKAKPAMFQVALKGTQQET